MATTLRNRLALSGALWGRSLALLLLSPLVGSAILRLAREDDGGASRRIAGEAS